MKSCCSSPLYFYTVIKYKLLFVFSDICLPRQVRCWPVLRKKGVSSRSVQSLQAHLQQHPRGESTAGGGGKTARSNTSWSVLLILLLVGVTPPQFE